MLLCARLSCGALMCATVFSCAFTERVATVDRTQGMSFDFYWNDPTEQRSLRGTLTKAGIFGFAGGTAATFEAVNWTTSLSDAQITALRDKISASGLLHAESGRLGDGACKIEFTFRDGESKGTLHGEGETPALVDLRKYIVELSMIRFAETIDALPKGGAPKK